MRAAYRGESDGKTIARRLIWWQHERLLGPAFKRTPHMFLASRIAGDVEVLRSMRVTPDNIWAVESNPAEYKQLFGRKGTEGFRLMTRKIECVVEDDFAAGLRSVYLDFCGNLQGTARARRRVVSQLPSGSALSINLFLGREHDAPEDREKALLDDISKHAQHPVRLVQSVAYARVMGSPMTTWTFLIGTATSRSKMRYNLNEYTESQLSVLAGSEVTTRKLWQGAVDKAERRSRGAVQANVTRQSA